jgi:hypothetical protein
LPLLLTDHLEIRKVHQIPKVSRGDEIDFGLLAAQMQKLCEL